MPADHALTLASASPEHTCRIAQALAPRLQAGDVILLAGDVGAGKTHFARCAIRACLVADEEIPSPTYTLVQTYAGRHGEIWHVDLYRLTDAQEVEELGLAQAFTEAICLVEWPDRLGEGTPTDALGLSMVPRGVESRDLFFQWSSPRWTDKLQGLADVRT